MAGKRGITGSQKAGSLPAFNAGTGQLRDSKGRFLSKADTLRVLEETSNGTRNVDQVLGGQSRYTDFKKSLGVTKVGTSRGNDGKIQSKSKTEDILSVARELADKGNFTEADVSTKLFDTEQLGGEKFTPELETLPLVNIPAFIQSETEGAWFEIIDQNGNVRRTQDPQDAEMIARDIMDEQIRIVEELEAEAEANKTFFYKGSFFMVDITTSTGKKTGNTKVSIDFSKLGTK